MQFKFSFRDPSAKLPYRYLYTGTVAYSMKACGSTQGDNLYGNPGNVRDFDSCQ